MIFPFDQIQRRTVYCALTITKYNISVYRNRKEVMINGLDLNSTFLVLSILNLAFSIWPKNTSTCEMHEPGIESPNFWLLNDLLYLLSHSQLILIHKALHRKQL